jgi:hypothetical protein
MATYETSIGHNLHTRNPRTLSSILILIITSTLSLFVTRSISCLAVVQSKQGMKNDVPCLKLRQLML